MWSHSGALGQATLQALRHELEHVYGGEGGAAAALERQKLVGSKLPTHWLPLSALAEHLAPQRSAVERAVAALLPLAVRAASGPGRGALPGGHPRDTVSTAAALGIVGAEWWAQRKPLDCDIPFHFDKDEAR